MNNISGVDFDYETLKSGIVEVFQLTSENYRDEFRHITFKPEKTGIKSFITKYVGHTFDSWVKYSGIEITDAKAIPNLENKSWRKFLQTCAYIFCRKRF